ncbi:Carbamoyltransferase HypF [Candidatus Magnetomoraceae bacterium gMMP-15]
MNILTAKILQVNGIVQGVGFRPFIYRLAIYYNLKGNVANTCSGVLIHIEGKKENIEAFCKDLSIKAPKPANITNISIQAGSLKNYKNFSIKKSKVQPFKSTFIPPDMAVCKDCLKELFDPADQRYCYPFINCTNCGPRYSIIDDIPYDRPKTSMKYFKMCNRCQSEYNDPADRRFHAQPNACKNCGPTIDLYDKNRKKIDTEDSIKKTAKLLKQGKIIAIKGLGGFHLAVDAENNDAVIRLRKKKHRKDKPFALMSYNLKQILQYAHVSPKEEVLLTSRQRPIVILRKKKSCLLSQAISPENKYFAVMLPYTPLHYLILHYDFSALVMTSGNISNEPIIIDNEQAFKKLVMADYFLIHNRKIYQKIDDSIVKHTSANIRFIRRSRGYVPSPIFLKNKVPPILACGAELKNTICLAKENNAFLSQHIGDLKNPETFEFFKSTIEFMKKILKLEPEIIACDFHPDYLSTTYAMNQKQKKIKVQHHHAHIVSCMAENKIDSPVIGLAFDGTGYGTDNALWGGEILIADAGGFTRSCHLSYIPMPGSALAVKEPWRMAISYLYDAFGEDFLNLDLPILKEIEESKIRLLIKIITKKINSPYTSSLGRLFDGIAAIMGIRNKVSFEGQAAIELEMLANEHSENIYDYEFISSDMHRIILKPIIYGIVKDMINGIYLAEISSKFHKTLIYMFSELCTIIKKESKLNQVVLSGGAFQNSILLNGLIRELEKKNFKVFTHCLIPANDGGISLGQALIAAELAKNN